MILAQFPIFSICQFREIANSQYCWFALDVAAAMLVVKNKSISLLWEPDSIFILILGEKLYCIDPQHGRLVLWLQTKNASFVVSFNSFATPLMNPNFVIFVKPSIIDMPLLSSCFNFCQTYKFFVIFR